MLTNPGMAVQGGWGRRAVIGAGSAIRVCVALEFSKFAAMIAALFTGTGTSMPIYEYQCQDCQHKLEVMQRMSDSRLTTCPTCGKESLKKLVSAVGFQLKGTGWYETDFKGKPKAPRGGEGDSAGSSPSSDASAPAPAPAPSSDSSSSESKTKSSTASAEE